MATSPCISQSGCRLARIARFSLLSIATFALYNYPRSWWQELICGTALVWIPICVVGLFVGLKRVVRGPVSLLGCVVVVLHLMCVMKIVGMARPYLYAAPKRYSSLSYSLPTRIALLDLTERGEEASLDALSFAEIESPDVLIVARFTETPLPSGVRSWYPHVLVSSTTSGRTVEIFSKAPSHPPERTEYGYGALPGVLGSFETPDGVLFQLGAFDLMLSSSQDSFNKSRLTSRRLASALKYSAEPRIVVGAFRASVTSQLVNMYSDQLKLRSIFFDGGLSRLWRCLVGSIALSQNLNAFTAKNIELLGQREVPPNSQGLAAILFTVRVPRPRGS